MDKNKRENIKVNSNHELLNTYLDEYKINELIKETGKDWVFEAFDTRLNRLVALKVLKPRQGKEREEQFLREGQRLATLGKFDHIMTVYSAGQTNGYYYMAMELITGEDLEDLINKRKFSLEKIVEVIEGVTEAVSYAHEHGIEHEDVKLENIKLGNTYVVDFAGRLTKTNSNDINAIGLVFRQLLGNYKRSNKSPIPQKLEEIIERSLNNKYGTVYELRKEIRTYKNGISRRKFLKTTGSLAGLSLFGYGSFKILDYYNSLDYIVDEINDVEATDFSKINPLFNELLQKIINYKIDWLIEDGRIPKGKFPYATTEDEKWFNIPEGYWSNGFWPGILWMAYETTKKNKYKQWALEWTKAINFTDQENEDIRSTRFYYSHAKAYDIIKDQISRSKTLRAADFMASRFNEVGDFIQIGGKLDKTLNNKKINVELMTISLPLLGWAYNETKDEKYNNIIIKHSKTTRKFNIRDDSSVRRLAIFNPKNKTLMGEENDFGYNNNSTHARSQARAIYGFTLVYKLTKDEEFLLTAEHLADYFIDHLPQDFVPFYDFGDPNKNILKDSSAATIAIPALLDLFSITRKEKYRVSAYSILKSLSSKYLSTNLNHFQGIVLHGCHNIHEGYYTNSSLIYGDYHFIEGLRKIKN